MSTAQCTGFENFFITNLEIDTVQTLLFRDLQLSQVKPLLVKCQFH
jgi:hypothetical protein